jgi:hypothetical protein
VLTLGLAFAACGGDDDDNSGGGATVAATDDAGGDNKKRRPSRPMLPTKLVSQFVSRIAIVDNMRDHMFFSDYLFLAKIWLV